MKSLTIPHDARQLSMFDAPLFDRIKHIDENGDECWYARELLEALGYTKWSNFKKALKKTVTTLDKAHQIAKDHIAGSSKMIQAGKGAQREIEDFKLSRFACYLIAENSDPDKEAVALAKVYFAVQTHRQEQADEQAKKKRQQDVTAYQLHGKSHDWADQRVTSKDNTKRLNAALQVTHVDHAPNYGEVSATVNYDLLGMTKQGIVEYLGLLPKDADHYRDSLGFYALQAINLVNSTSEHQMKALGRPLTSTEQLDIVRSVIATIRPSMEHLAELAHEDYVSGQPVNDQGNALLTRNVRLLR